MKRMRATRWVGVALALALLAAGNGWAAVGGSSGVVGGNNGGNNKNKSPKPGSDKTYTWRSIDLDACKKAGKPVMLYVYDNELKTASGIVDFFETTLFPNDKVKEAVKDFTYVMIPKTSQAWPAQFTAAAEKGAALYLLTCEGTPMGSWDKNNRPTIDTFVGIAKGLAAANAAIAEKVKKELEKQKEKEQAAAQQVAANKNAVAGAIPGLGDPAQNDKKKDDKKADGAAPAAGVAAAGKGEKKKVADEE